MNIIVVMVARTAGPVVPARRAAGDSCPEAIQMPVIRE
jgi:hypothetical protein